jgi:hypothetical protein
MKRNITYPLISIAAILVFGILMLFLANPGHSGGYEQASVYFIEEIWSRPAGVTFLVFGLVLLIILLVNRKKPLPEKPGSPSTLFYRISFFIFKITFLLYAIMLLQYVLTSFKILSSDYSYDDESMSNIHMVCIMFIIIFGIIALITGLVSRAGRKKMNA